MTDMLKKKGQIVSGFLILIFLSGFSWPWSSHQETKKAAESYRNKNYQQSIETYENILKKNPSSSEGDKLRYNLASAYYQNKDYAQARQLWSDLGAVAEHSQLDQDKVYYSLGNALVRENRYAEALEAYKKALQINPDDEDSKFNIEVVYQKMKQEPSQNQERQDQDSSKQQEQKEQQNQQEQKAQDKQQGQQDNKDTGSSGTSGESADSSQEQQSNDEQDQDNNQSRSGSQKKDSEQEQEKKEDQSNSSDRDNGDESKNEDSLEQENPSDSLGDQEEKGKGQSNLSSGDKDGYNTKNASGSQSDLSRQEAEMFLAQIDEGKELAQKIQKKRFEGSQRLTSDKDW